MKKKTLALIVAMIMVFSTVIGGTLAWLQAESNEVVNTFTFGDIDIKLDETDTDNSTAGDNDRDTANAYKLIPGNTYVKDPMVTVEAGSEECYIFVEIVEENNTYTDLTGKIIDYAINTTDWTPVAESSNVYYYKETIEALEVEEDVFVESTVLATTDGKNITINANLTKAMLEAIEAMELDKQPKITFKAYAVQAANMDDAVDAWNSTYGTATVAE